MVKVGDRVKLVKRGGAWCNYNVGKEGTVTGRKLDSFVTVLFDNSEGEEFEEDYGNPSHLKLISTTHTYSIPADTETVTLKYADGSTQDIDVKARARGVPEWVKDGAWVVNSENGNIYKLEIKGGFIKAIGNKGWTLNTRKEFGLPADFRPFTNSDWKWGMWAEYRGEKVFVSDREGSGIAASSRTDSLFFIPFDKITPTTAP